MSSDDAVETMGTNSAGAGSHAAVPIDLDKAMVVVGEVQAAEERHASGGFGEAIATKEGHEDDGKVKAPEAVKEGEKKDARKPMASGSEMWKHFEKIMIDGVLQKGKCNYCKTEIAAHTVINDTFVDKSTLMDQRSSRGSTSSQEDKSDASNRIVRSKEELELHLLPLDILQYILSRLSVKEVVRMSILSCEWRQLRICHPDLVFTKNTFGNTIWNNEQASEFIANVDNVLHPLWSTSTTTATTLNKFVVNYRLGRSHKNHIDRWISFSTASRAKHIGLVFKLEWTSSENDKYVLSLCNLSGPNGSCVESLELCYVSLKLPPSFCGIKNLKKLTLHTVSVNLSDFQCLLLSCALLESLNIESINWLSQECCSFQSLCIHQELCRLQHLRARYSNLDMIELHASNLQKFDFDDHLVQVVLNECLKLSEATFVSTVRTLEFDEYGLDFTFNNLPTAIPHVHKLFLLLNVDQVLRFSDNQSHFMNLRHLNMNLEIFSYPLDTSWAVGLVNLLELAPLLEELELHLGADSSRPSAISSPTAIQGPLHRHLKSVYISGFCDVLGLAELALYILGNATALKCMVVDPAAYSDPVVDDIYSVSKGGSSKELPCHINQKRIFAEKNLDKEEFRHILTIL